MEGWVIALVIILAILMAGISGLVGYLLFRPRERKRPRKNGLSPDGQVATKYDDPPENGDIKIPMPEENESSLPPYSSNESTMKGRPKDTSVYVDEEYIDKEKKLVKEVEVYETKAGPVVSAYLEDKESPAGSGLNENDEGKKKKSSSSSSSSEEEEKEKSSLKDKDSADDSDGKAEKKRESSSSSSHTSDADIPEPMPPINPQILTGRQTPKRAARDSPDLVSDVLAIVNKTEVEDAKKEVSSSSSSSDSDENKIKAPPIPFHRTIKPSDKVSPTKRNREKKPKPKHSSSKTDTSDTEDEKPKLTDDKVSTGKKKSSTSSDSSSDSRSSEGEAKAGVPIPKTEYSTSSSSSSDEDKTIFREFDDPSYATPKKTDERLQTKAHKEASSSSTSSSSSDDLSIRGAPRPRHAITFQSGWGKPVKLSDLCKAGLVDPTTAKGLKAGIIPKHDMERRLRPYLIGTEPVGGVLISETGEQISVYSAWKRGLITKGTCLSLLEAQAATGRILDPIKGEKYSVEQASRAGLIDTQLESILNRAERAVYGYTAASSPDVLSVHQAINRRHVVENRGMPLLEAQMATGGVIDPKVNHRVPIEVALKRGLIDKQTVELLQNPGDEAKGYVDPNTSENVTYAELLSRCVTDKNSGMRLYLLQSVKPELSLPTKKFPLEPGVSITTQTEKTSPSSSSTSSSSTSEAEMEISIGTGEIATQTPDLPNKQKKNKRKTPRTYKRASPKIERPSSFRSGSMHSSESERETYRYNMQGLPKQGARPFSSPHREQNTSPHNDRSTQTLFPPKAKYKKMKPTKAKSTKAAGPIIITLAEKDVQTMKTTSSESEEEIRETIVRTQTEKVQRVDEKIISTDTKGIQMTPATSSSSSSSSESDKKKIRSQKDVTVGRVDEKLVSTRRYVAERKTVTSETSHKVRTEPEPISVDLGKPENCSYKAEKVMDVSAPPKKIYFKTSWGRQVDLNDMYDAKIVDYETKLKLETGELDPSDEIVVRMISPYINGNRPVAGVLHTKTGKKYSIFEAAKRGLIRRSTAVALLEAQAATGNLIDPHSGRSMTVEQAQKEGFIEGGYEAIIIRAERAVHGYKTQSSNHPLSVFEAMKQGIVVPSHGIHLLEAQLATGGIIDPRANHRVPLEAAYQRRLFDQHAMNRLNAPGSETKGFVDPNTQKNITYLEIVAHCVTDLETGVLLFPLELQERGRSPTSSANLSSYASVEVKSPSRSRSREKRTHEFSVAKPSTSSQSSSSDESRKRKTKEIKITSTSIELARTPVMSADDDDAFERREKRQVVTTNVEVGSTYQSFDPVEFEVVVKPPDAKEETSSSSDSSSSSSSSDDDEKISVERTTDVKTTADKDSSTSEVTTTTTIVTTTEVTTEKAKKSRHDIKLKSGWGRRVSLLDLLAAGVVTQETVEKLEKETIREEEVEKNIQQYLVGAEPIAGILISETGEKISIYSAWRKGLIRRGTSISLLEAQAATGRILDPKTGKRYSVEEASKEGLIDRQFEAVLTRAERAVYGYTTRTNPDVISLFQAMKRGLVVENHGIRLLEAQIATGGIIDPKANHRLPVEVAYARGLFDKRMNVILEDPSDDTRGFFDPNTEENLTYFELMERCIVDTDTGMRLLPLRTHRDTSSSKRSKVVFESRTGRQVTITDLVNANRLDQATAKRIDQGTITSEEKEALVAKLRVFVDGKMPIAGVISTASGERMSIYEAAKSELIRRGTAFELLEAQACCGKLIDVQSGKVITIETALRSGVIDKEFKDVVERAHRAVTGYREPFKRELLSLCEAINRHLVVRRHGIRLLEAQIATGGIVDVKSPVRISPEVALKRALIDAKLAEDLDNKITQSYFDPVTGENLNYSEMMGRCVTDKDTGLLYLMVEGGTVTGYVRPFEPEHSSKIRSQSANAGKITTEEVTTTRSSGASSMGDTEVTTTVESTEYVRTKRRKKRTKLGSAISTSSTPSTGNDSTGSELPSVISRKVVIVDPDTKEEITVREALKRRLIDRDTAKQLIAQQAEYEETP